jgi:hypothetical protein
MYLLDLPTRSRHDSVLHTGISEQGWWESGDCQIAGLGIFLDVRETYGVGGGTAGKNPK